MRHHHAIRRGLYHRIVMTGVFASVIAAAMVAANSTRGADEVNEVVPLDDRLGVVEANKEVPLSVQLRAEIKEVLVEIDQAVKKGDPLVKLDDELQALAVKEAKMVAESKAAVEAAEAQLAVAQTDLEKQKSFLASGGGSERDVRLAEATEKLRQAELTRAEEESSQNRIRLELEEAKLKRYTIYAPFDGRVMEIFSDVGATTDDQEPVLLLLELDPLIAEVSLPRMFRDKLEVGRNYSFTRKMDDPQAAAKRYIGKLKTMAPKDDYGSGTFKCRFEIANPEGKIAPGFGVHFDWPQQDRGNARAAEVRE